MTTADNNYPESVSRICGELQNLSTQMLELRRTQPGFPTPAAEAPSEAREDTAMDVDQDEVFFRNKLAYITAQEEQPIRTRTPCFLLLSNDIDRKEG